MTPIWEFMLWVWRLRACTCGVPRWSRHRACEAALGLRVHYKQREPHYLG